MNVAVTRGKRHVTIIGDDQTIKGDAFLRRLVEHVEVNAAPVIARVDLFAPIAAPL
jgi:superfamily I DNA and/or RNA helicase